MGTLERMLDIKEDDLMHGEEYLKTEQVRPITRESVFLAFLYSVLAQREHFTNLQIKFNGLIATGLVNPEKLLANQETFREISNSWESKYKGTIAFAEWFKESQIELKLIEDCSNGRSNGFELRNEIAEHAPRISYKSASLAMMKFGYGQIAPIDIHAMNFLHAYLKSNNKISKDWSFLTRATKKIRGGIRSKKDYLSAEELFSEIAAEYGTTPSILQSTVYLMNSFPSKQLRDFKTGQLKLLL